MTEATLREQMYRRWKKGEDYFVLAKEMGVTRERMRIILKKMDAEVPLVDRIEAQAAEIERLQAKLAKAEAILEREIIRVKKIQSDLPPPHKVPLYAVQGEYELMLEEMRGGQP